MKLSTSTITRLILVFLWSIFMGVTAISIGIGSLFPSMNLIAGPFVCPQGQLVLEENVSNPLPETTYTILHWYCVDKQSGAKTELNPLTLSLYAGPVYGVLLFVVIVAFWYLFSKWDAPNATSAERKWSGWLQAGIVIAIVAGLTSINLLPLFRSMTSALAPTATPEYTPTALALTFEALTLGQPVVFDSTEKPLTNWKGVPIMSQATAGQEGSDHTYTFRADTDSGTIETFYHEQLKSLGWNLVEDRWLGMKFTKDKNILLVTLAPDSDLESWVVTLVLIP